MLLVRAIFREGGHGIPTPAPGATSPRGELISPWQARGPLPKEQKKFYKLGNAPLGTPPAPVSEPRPDPDPAPVLPEPEPETVKATPVAPAIRAEEEAKPVLPELPPDEVEKVRRQERKASPVPEPTGRRRRLFTGKQRVTITGLGIGCALVAFALGWFVGGMNRPVPAKKAPAPVAGIPAAPVETVNTLATRAISPDDALRRALATIDEASNARAANDWGRVETLLEQAEREAGPNGVPGLLLQRAQNALRQGKIGIANSLAQRSIDAGEEVAKSYALRAALAHRNRQPRVALAFLEAASRADPFDGRFPFYQSQALRGQGKLREAASHLRQAVNRAEDNVQAESYSLTLRLTLIELGEDGTFADELTRRLAQPYVASDWLVTAAARECQAGRAREGADLLRRAFVQAGPSYAALRLADVFFRRFIDQPEMAPLYAQYLPAPPPPAEPAATPAFPPRLPGPEPTASQADLDLLSPAVRGDDPKQP